VHQTQLLFVLCQLPDEFWKQLIPEPHSILSRFKEKRIGVGVVNIEWLWNVENGAEILGIFCLWTRNCKKTGGDDRE